MAYMTGEFEVVDNADEACLLTMTSTTDDGLVRFHFTPADSSNGEVYFNMHIDEFKKLSWLSSTFLSNASRELKTSFKP